MSSLNLVHLSDIHFNLRGDESFMLVEATNRFLHACIETFNRDDTLDAVFISGDCLNNGHQQELAAFEETLARLEKPVFIVPGNHDGNLSDDPAVFTQRHFAGRFNPQFAARPEQGQAGYFSQKLNDDVRLIALDTSIPGQTGGRVDEAQLAWLKDELTQHPEQLVIIGLHHPLHPLFPQDEAGQWKDWFVCDNGTEVQTCLDQHPAAQLVLCGHHHTSKAFRAGKQLHLAAPPFVSYPCGYRHIQLEKRAAGWQIAWQTHTVPPELQAEAHRRLIESDFARVYCPDTPAAFAEMAAGDSTTRQHAGPLTTILC